MPDDERRPSRGDRFTHTRLPGVCEIEEVTRDRVRYRNDRDGAVYSKPVAAFGRVVARWHDDEEPPGS